jgi:hypothetical protein
VGITELIEAVRQLRADSEIQLQRIADLQAQLDVTLAAFHRLEAPSRRQRGDVRSGARLRRR